MRARGRAASRAQIVVFLALAAVGLVGIATLGIDAFYIYWNKNRLQNGTDAAALAGATYFSNVIFTGKNPSCAYSSDAQNAACTYALDNGVSQSELTNVTANASTQTMTVSATRRVSALFAKVLGVQNFTVSATSVAVLRGLSSATGVAPVGLDSLTPYAYGESINLRMDDCGAGCWHGLALQSATHGNRGASAFQQNLAQGCSCTVAVGDLLAAEPGLKTSSVTKGVSARLAAGIEADPDGTWSSHTIDDVRSVVLPVVNWSGGCGGGRCSDQVPVTGFAEVWLVGTTGGDTINAVFIRQVAVGTPSSGGVNMGAVHAQLIQ
jgi:hypothetical protein